jgi:hypothetical protein
VSLLSDMLHALNGAKHLLTCIPSLNAMCRGASAARPAKEWPRIGAKIELRGDQQIVGDDHAATASSTTAEEVSHPHSHRRSAIRQAEVSPGLRGFV